MNRRSRTYICLVVLLGMSLGVFSCVKYFPDLQSMGWAGVPQLLCIIVLCAVSRACPIYMRSNQALDVSVIGVLAVYLTYGTNAAVFITLCSSVFAFGVSIGTGGKVEYRSIGLVKTLFNTSNIILSIVVPGLLCQAVGWSSGRLDFPYVLLPTLLFSVATFLVNALIALTLFRLNGEITTEEMRKMTLGLTPNVMAAMPLGLLIAELLELPSGPWLAMLMLVPLMLARYAWKLYLDSQVQQNRLLDAFISTMEAKDKYTQGHSERVGQYAARIAAQMRLDDKQISLIREGAVLHDIGKIGIDDRILRKPDKLEPEEVEQMQRHPLIGVSIVEHVGLDPAVVAMIRSHHERMDGSGYPDRLRGDEIPQAARILGVADAYDAMTSDRPYRKGMSRERAVEILQTEPGQFDQEVVRAFVAVLLGEGAK